MKSFFLLLIALVLNTTSSLSQTPLPVEMLIRVDDSGMNHATNTALKELCDSGIPFSTSIMFACPWYQESVALLKNYPHVTVGIHLTLNAEWENYRWGPVSGRDKVPSLVDSLGFFVPSRAAFDKLNPKIEDIETELRAQIERALQSGLKIEYVDYHMGTAVDKPERRALLEKLAKEYGLGISRYFGEVDVDIMYAKPIKEKKNHLVKITKELTNKQVNLLVCHIIDDSPEAQALKDLNSFGLKEMSKHRQAELQALLSPEFKKSLAENKVKLITYHELIQRVGLENMQETKETGY
ncbi:ChbG/HpnK family deacetylase [bacterium]|nr:MAG: ChbG/HpnK family deacetylase [bacterium]